MSKKNNKADNRALGMIAVNNTKNVDGKKLKKKIEKDWKNFPKIANINDDNGVITLFLKNNDAFFAMFIPKPIPWSDLEGPCATAYLWPKATEEMKNHTGHYIVSFTGTQSNYSILEQSLLVTKLMISIAEITDIIGFYWGSGTVVNSPKLFINEGKACFKDGILPVFLWIDYRIQRNKDKSYNIITTGMNTFGHKEIEVHNTKKNPNDLLDYLWFLTRYLIEKGPIIKDGDTFGMNAKDKSKVRFAPSLWDRPDVMILEFN